MQKIIRGLAVNAEQQIANRPQQGTLTGFVFAIHHMEVAFRCWKREFQIRKRAKRRNMQSLKPHVVVPPFVWSDSRMMARTSPITPVRASVAHSLSTSPRT